MIKKHSLFSMPFASGSKSEILAEVFELAERRNSSSVIFANAHVVVEAEHSMLFKQKIQKADLIVPDGVPITWLLKALGEKESTRYSGPDLMADVFKKAPQSRHFFLGSNEKTLSLIKEKFLGNAVGFYSPPFVKDEFDGTEKQKHLLMINEAKPDFIWVGLGAPKQERYVIEMAARASRGVWLAVGAAFDFFAGTKPRAPEFLQAAGLEWAFRMATEPKRLASRYLKTNPAFLSLALRAYLKR
jgi:N-acetylglucosaminyldiphosphoundecaprenol N-acetyl-beta-D-mannosaminyltransferase